MALVGNLSDFVRVLAVVEPAGENPGLADLILMPISIGTLIAWFVTSLWAKSIQPQRRLVISLATGTLLSALFYVAALTIYHLIDDNIYSFRAAAVMIAFNSFLVWPILIILGPVAAVCLIQAREGRASVPTVVVSSA